MSTKPTVKILHVTLLNLESGYCAVIDGKGERRSIWWNNIRGNRLPPVPGDVWTSADNYLLDLVTPAPIPEEVG